jgi:hypothetical protein
LSAPPAALPGPAPRAAGTWRRLETILIALVTLHTLIVGSMLLFVPAWALAFGGWKGGTDILFFPRQGGVFHYVVAFGYLYEYFRHRGVALLVAAKTIAFVFLMSLAVVETVPWAVPVSGVLDALMAMVVVLAHRRAAWEAPVV